MKTTSLAACMAGLGLLLGGAAWAQTAEQARIEMGRALPEGPGKAFVLSNCVNCHDLTPIVSSSGDAAFWTDTIHRFLGRGFREDAVKEAAVYLAKNFPPKPAQAAPAKSITSGKQVENFVPVTDAMLLNPPDGDWLHINRTYDGHRYSPLKQITQGNVKNLRMAWSRGIGASGWNEGVPLVHDGVIYAIAPGAVVLALDGRNGEKIWEYKYDTKVAPQARQKNLGLYQDVLIYMAPDGVLIGLDARNGKLRWQHKVSDGLHSAGVVVAKGKVISGRTCNFPKDCFISANDPLTGKELWRFYTMPRPGEPGSETWGKDGDYSKFVTSSWGLPGAYDPARNLLVWGVANPTPYSRIERYGRWDAIGTKAPIELYSNSTVALDLDTGKLVWYYQYLPGDDWDQDFNENRVLARTPISPDPKHVKWFNPDIPKGEVHDVVVSIGEGGGFFVVDRSNGKFLWGMPFPYDSPNFLIKNIDGRTGITEINDALIAKKPGDRNIICSYNTVSYWPTAYIPDTNSYYAQYVDNCLDMQVAGPQGPQTRVAVAREGGKPEEFAGIAKINLETGELVRFGQTRSPNNGALLATSSKLLFHGTVDRKFRAYNADTGAVLWETLLGGPIQNSTITYSVDGKQYILVMTGEGNLTPKLSSVAGVDIVRDHHAFYAFALP